MRLGLHMPLKGGFVNNIKRVKELGGETVQIFPGNPTGWRIGKADPREMEKRVAALQENRIFPLVIHSAYLINLAAASPDIYRNSVQLLNETMERAHRYGSPYVVLHTGNHGGRGVEAGLEQIVATVERELPGWPEQVKLLFENTAGSGTALGSRFEELGWILKALPRQAVGFCLDTAHAWAAGYDLNGESAVDDTLEQFDRHVGIEHLQVLHINDTHAECGSRVDRHAHIGHGRLGLAGFKKLLNHNWPEQFPVILETPEMGGPWDRKNLETLRALLA